MPKVLTEPPIHLGLGATAVPQPLFTGLEWYADYSSRTASDGTDNRLVSMHTFDPNLDSWEMHPNGAEVVRGTTGEITLVQEVDGEEKRIKLTAGDYRSQKMWLSLTSEHVAPGSPQYTSATQAQVRSLTHSDGTGSQELWIISPPPGLPSTHNSVA